MARRPLAARRPTTPRLAPVALAWWLAACGGGGSAATTTAPATQQGAASGGAQPAAPAASDVAAIDAAVEASPAAGDGGATSAAAADAGPPSIAPSHLVAMLNAHHVDVEHVGALHTLPPDARDLVMQSFTDSLNVRCVWCHVDGDFAAPTVRKAITEVMWDRFVHGLRFRDHSQGALYCDSCHQGHGTFLVRGDDDAVGEYMNANYVQPLERTDASASRCTYCHGRPFQPRFLPRALPAHHGH